jgi:hypothetical protein
MSVSGKMRISGSMNAAVRKSKRHANAYLYGSTRDYANFPCIIGGFVLS